MTSGSQEFLGTGRAASNVSGTGIDFSLRFAESDLPRGMRVRSVRLEEHLSRPYRAAVELVSPEPASRKALKELLGQKLRLLITRAKASRTLLGTVTSVRSLGIYVARSGETDSRKLCCRYEVGVEPSLALLRETLRTRHFVGLKAPEVIRSILSDYGIQDEGKDSDPALVDLGDFDDTVLYEQAGESDLSFIDGLVRLYGLNYRFVHRGTEPGDPEFWLSMGWSFGADEPAVSLKLFAEEPRLFAWEMTASSGPDEILLGKAPEEESSLEPRKRTITLPGAPFRTLRNCSALYGVRENERIEAALKAALKRSETVWRGSAADLGFVPGVKLAVEDAFGENSETLNVLVVGAELFCRAAWPSDMVIPPEVSSEIGERFEQRIEAVETAASGPCGCLAGLNPSEPDSGKGRRLTAWLGRQAPAANTVQLLRATVDEGLSDEAVDASDGPRLLQVRLPGAEGAVAAELAYAPSGDRERPRVMPRPGDEVLAAEAGSRLFVIGSLSAAHAPKSTLEHFAQAARLSCGDQGDSAGMFPGGKNVDFIMNRVVTGTLSSALTAMTWEKNNSAYLGLKTAHAESLRKKYADYREAEAQYAAALLDTSKPESFEKTLDALRTAYEEAGSRLLDEASTLAAEMAAARSSDPSD